MDLATVFEPKLLERMSFLESQEAIIGYFAFRMEQYNNSFFSKALNNLIHMILNGIIEVKEKWLANNQNNFYSPIYQSLDVDLITFKIGDLMRCKFASREEEVLRVFHLIKDISDDQKSRMLKIIRIKNRLSEGTRDILMNVFF